jgi:hypothetical protein
MFGREHTAEVGGCNSWWGVAHVALLAVGTSAEAARGPAVGKIVAGGGKRSMWYYAVSETVGGFLQHAMALASC